MPRSRPAPYADGPDEEFEPRELQHQESIGRLDLRTNFGIGDTHTGFSQGDDQPGDNPQGGAHLHARVAPDTGKAAVALETRLAQARWPGFAVLVGGEAGNTRPASAATHARAEALVDALLASIDIDPATAAPGMDAQSVQTAAVQAYLRGCADDDTRSPSTLPEIKQLLLSRAAPRPKPPATAESEPLQNRRLLLPLLLLNTFARPRTPSQRQDACDRLDLLQGCASAARLP